MQVQHLHSDGVYGPEELKEIEAEVAAGSVPGENDADIQERAARAFDRRRLTRESAPPADRERFP